MDTTQLLRDAAPVGFLKSPICRGHIQALGKAPEVMVLLPEGSSERPYGPCKIAPIWGATVPQVGAECVVIFDERNNPTVMWWEGTLSESVIAVNEETESYTLTLEDGGRVIEMNSAVAVNLTVPSNEVPFPIGTFVEVTQMGTGQVTLKAGAGVTLLTPSSLTTRVRYSTVGLRKRATNIWVVSGDLT